MNKWNFEKFLCGGLLELHSYSQEIEWTKVAELLFEWSAGVLFYENYAYITSIYTIVSIMYDQPMSYTVKRINFSGGII